ncbi:MAG: hypothetical protein QT03_C0001G1160 [archaeon GW2011_AR10]|uniref:UPF0235 protein HA237_02490 n=1 Tax=Candidatus Iainarchaeum sp. TaxID=3101447 RepID=A0A7J4IV36_9ARCH|nr:MAG: hypothetical protein QT03_C0001G1160 [archaeon GW2011_AR10]HIH08219.1 YggU family protein [Candidatus Diapherotrites archaeon]
MKGFILNLHVTSNSKEFKLEGFDFWRNALKLKTKSKPLKGQANKEIEAELEKLLEAKVKIVSGKNSRNKKVLVEKSREEALAKLGAFNLLKKP